MIEINRISILALTEFSPFIDTVLKWVMIFIVLGIVFLVYNRTNTFAKGHSGNKLSFRKRTKPYNAEIHLSKNRRLSPSIIEMSVTNTGIKIVDLEAPIIIFKRWFTNRRFRILKVEHSEIYPILLDPGRTSTLEISLDQFFESVPELQLACRMSVEMKDRKGKRFKSQTIRLKWF
jgi:hypothetical protein